MPQTANSNVEVEPTKNSALQRTDFPTDHWSWMKDVQEDARGAEATWRKVLPQDLAPWRFREGHPPAPIFQVASRICPSGYVNILRDVERILDPFSFRNLEGISCFYRAYLNGTYCAYDTSDGQAVVVHLIRIGQRGEAQMRVLKHLTALPDILRADNHTLPMLREIQLFDDLILGVFPYVPCGADESIWGPHKHLLDDVLDIIMQVLEGVAFIHEHGVAHRDCFLDNFLQQWYPNTAVLPPTVVRPRVYLIDFETAMCFPDATSASERRVNDHPMEARGSVPEHYARPRAPELKTRAERPYDPLALDIWQLGRQLDFIRTHVAEIDDLFATFWNDDPEARPTAAQALRELRTLVRDLPAKVLDGGYEKLGPYGYGINVVWDWEDQ